MAPRKKKSPMDEDGDDHITVKEYYKSWAEHSACDSFPQIPRCQSWPRRLIWIAIVLTLTTYSTIEVVNVLKEYFKYPVNTNINYTYSSSLTFPAITLCNMNPVRKSKLAESGTAFDSLLGTTNGQFTSGKKKRAIDQPSNSDQRGTQKFSFIRGFQTAWAQLGKQTRQIAGHQLDDMLVSCSMGGEKCGSVIEYSSGIYGNCFVFNSALATNSSETVSKTGPLFGLTLELFLEQEEYLPELTEQTAARLHINNRRAMPFPEYSGFNIAPGYLTTIGLKMIRVTREEGYESNCSVITEEEAAKYSIYSYVYSVNYTREACFNTCYQRAVITKCRCGDPHYVFTYNFFKDEVPETVTSIKPCISNDDLICMEEVVDMYSRDELSCHCPLPCEEYDYQTTISVSPWPSQLYTQSLRDALKSMGRYDVLNASFTTNLVKLEIYYDTLNYQHIYESPKYTTLSLISDLGGQIGLWLGASLILVLQSIELVIDMLIMCFKRMFQCGTKVTSVGR